MLLLDNIQKIKSSFRYEIINTQCSLRCLSVKANTSKLSVLNAVDPETPQSQPRPEFDVALTEMTPTNFTVNNSVTLSGSLNNIGESEATKEPPDTTAASITHMTVTSQKVVKTPKEWAPFGRMNLESFEDNNHAGPYPPDLSFQAYPRG